MLGLPATTEFNKKISKQMFYENAKITPEQKKVFVSDIKSIYWCNKISPQTINVSEGENVSEIEIFKIDLHNEIINESILKLVDKSIPYNIVFVLEFQEKQQLWVQNKKISESGSVSADKYFYTEWQNRDEQKLEIKGLNLDAVWENIVTQIGGIVVEEGNTLIEQIAADEKRAKLKKEIVGLESKIRKEKQLNVQMKLNSELKKLKKELEML